MRKIIHCDCDCFYAAIEIRDDPALAGRPVAVGGSPESRGVVATCNYEARAFGVRSAMSMAKAERLCPDLVRIRPRFEAYRSASRQILEIYREFTELVEPLSLDEAYLDVSGIDRCQGSATLMAREIRDRIRREVGITASAGVAPNKFLAKVASDWNKPDGQFVIRPDEVDAFVSVLPVRRIFGVGKVTAEKLQRLGVETCGQLRDWSAGELAHHFGSFGGSLYRLCRGQDDRPVAPRSARKSLSVETTFATDRADLAACRAEFPALIAELAARLAKLNRPAPIDKLFVKIRFDDFVHTTVECGGDAPDPTRLDALLARGWQRRSRPVRLLGVGVRFAEVDEKAGQLALFD
ncbi:MAG: DNA polymerase IV [Rhodocyclaceae bacterium]|nr:DNA polymerase IV [Rhodocyclaceae bacterium]